MRKFDRILPPRLLIAAQARHELIWIKAPDGHIGEFVTGATIARPDPTGKLREEGEMSALSATSAGSKIRSSIAAISQWWREWRDSTSEFRYCGEDAIEGMARDTGVSVDEFRQLARKGPHSADLLLRRMTALDLDPEEVRRIEPQTFHDLQRVCSMCRDHRRCVHDLAADAGNPAWKDYCPNVATLMALNALPWTSRREW